MNRTVPGQRSKIRIKYVAALVGLLVAGEIGARTFANEHSRFNIFIGANRQFHPQRKVSLKPGYRAGEISVNSRGFLGPEFEPQKIPGSFRVVVLGDSCSIVPVTRNYPRVLEGILRERYPDRRFDVINASCGGYASAQARHWYETEVSEYEHDMLIVYIGWNDMGQYGPEGLAFKLDEVGYVDEPSLLQRALLHVYLLRSFSVIHGYWERSRAVSLEPLTAEEKALYAGWYPRHFEDNLRTIIGLAQARGRSVFLLDYAGLVTASPTEQERRRMHFPRGTGRRLAKYWALLEAYEGVLQEVSSQTGAPLIDIKSLFGTPEERLVFADSVHFDAAGAERIAAHVADSIAPYIR